MNAFVRHTALVLAVSSTLFTASAASPATPLRTASPSSLERELNRQIDKFVTYPILRRDVNMDGDVFVTFVIDAEGKVKVMSASSANHALCEYVLRMLSKVDIGDNPNGTWKTTRMRFSFHPEV